MRNISPRLTGRRWPAVAAALAFVTLAAALVPGAGAAAARAFSQVTSTLTGCGRFSVSWSVLHQTGRSGSTATGACGWGVSPGGRRFL